jgi:hypothetical protein
MSTHTTKYTGTYILLLSAILSLTTTHIYYNTYTSKRYSRYTQHYILHTCDKETHDYYYTNHMHTVHKHSHTYTHAAQAGEKERTRARM